MLYYLLKKMFNYDERNNIFVFSFEVLFWELVLRGFVILVKIKTLIIEGGVIFNFETIINIL